MCICIPHLFRIVSHKRERERECVCVCVCVWYLCGYKTLKHASGDFRAMDSYESAVFD